jgi:transcriptional regulator with XRE-family HTH domain
MIAVRLHPDAVREAAARRNQTLAELAKALGVERSYLHALLRGQHEPSPRLRRRLLMVLGLTFDQLFSVARSDA